MLSPNTFKHKRPMVIDVSAWESPPDWRKIRDYGVVGVIFRATVGDWYTDSLFKSDYEKAREVGLLCGAYHYFYGNVDVKKQARRFLDAVGTRKLDFAPILDLEQRDVGQGRKKITVPSGRGNAANVKTWLDYVESETKTVPMIYTSQSYVKEKLSFLGFNCLKGANRYPLWVASYPNDPDRFVAPFAMPNGWKDWYMWQYSECGVVPGFPYDGVDLNLLNGEVVDGIPVDVPDEVDVMGNGVVMVNRLNVRTGPGREYLSVGKLNKDDVVTVTEVKSDSDGNVWGKIGESRWVAVVWKGEIYVNI